MLSSPETLTSAPRRTTGAFDAWNRRAHYFLGLYFLFFLWLFALTGLLLNHGQWEFAQFWPTRKVTTTEQVIHAPKVSAPLDQARDINRQLGVVGEIEWVTSRPDPSRLEFRVNRPGTNVDIKADFKAGRATVQRTQVNGWGVTRVLHTFTGVRANDPRKNERDWIVTSVWAWAMDAVAVGLVIMIASGVVIWWRGATQRRAGWIALISGSAVFAVFIFGLRWMVK